MVFATFIDPKKSDSLKWVTASKRGGLVQRLDGNDKAAWFFSK